MKLQILVNHYKEDVSTVERFLYSLESQKDVEFSVLIGSDGADKLNEEFLSKFNLDIKYEYLPHSGVCHTRNVLFNKSDADYVMFADIDDCFHSYDGLKSAVKAMEKTNADVVASPYLVESIHNKNYHYFTYYRDTVRVHGKFFKRQFLIDNNITFPDELETSGDMLFTWLCFSLTNKIIWLTNNFYTWKFNPSSVTRGVPYESVYHYPRTVKCYKMLADNLIKRKRPDLLENLVVALIPMMYLDSYSDTWQKAPKDYYLKAEKAMFECLDLYLDNYKNIDLEKRKYGYNFEKQGKKLSNPPKGFEGIISWGEEVLNKYKKQKSKIKANKNILIVGYGIVGHNLAKELEPFHPTIYDKYKEPFNEKNKKDMHKVAFICVDTPKTENNICDMSEVKNAILENNAEIYVIKSTILPGTTEKLIAETGKRIIFSPEYYGGTQHCNNYEFNYTILGGDKKDCAKVIQILQKVYDGRHQFKITDSKTAELVKYMENSYLATKVSFCQQFYRIAQEIGVTYEELRELFILDPRVNPSHTFIYEETPYWDSHCLNKDVPAIAEAYDAQLLKSVINFNEKCKSIKGKLTTDELWEKAGTKEPITRKDIGLEESDHTGLETYKNV